MNKLSEVLVRELVATVREDKALRAELVAALALDAQPLSAEYLTVAAYAKARSLGQSTVRCAIREGRPSLLVRNDPGLLVRNDPLRSRYARRDAGIASMLYGVSLVVPAGGLGDQAPADM